MSDQMSSYQSALRKTKKWYRKLALEFITGTSVVNAWVLYNKISPKKIKIRQFKDCIVENLMKRDETPETSAVEECIVPNSHVLQEAPGPKRVTRKRCRSCYDILSQNEGVKKARASARKVNTFCAACEGKPYLCISCFNLKHDL